MAFGNKQPSQLTEADLLALITGGEMEGKSIDYKRDRVGASDGDRKEFLYDLSSFANAAGGHLVIGMDESGGLPTALPGLAGIDPDAEIARLEQMARDGVRPPIPGLQSGAVALESGSVAIVIAIPKSWNPPHQVVFQKAFRFYGRDTNGKYQIDVDELRSIFALSASAAERIRQFRVERIASVAAGEAPVLLDEGAKLVIHVLPLSAFTGTSAPDLRPVWEDPTPLVAALGGGGSHRYNADGLLLASPSQPAPRYIQLFRSGAIEVVSGYSADAAKLALLPSLAFERDIIRAANGARQICEAASIQPPFIIAVSLLGMKDWKLGVDPGRYIESGSGFERDPLLIPELMLENLANPLTQSLKPLLDVAWNAAGWPQSIYYDRSGQRTES